MSEITDIGHVYPPAGLQAPAPVRTAPPSSTRHVQPSDTVELSEAALERFAEKSSLRIAKTRAIRVEINNGTFETPERINGTVDRLLDVIA